jgi:hypothetical protein
VPDARRLQGRALKVGWRLIAPAQWEETSDVVVAGVADPPPVSSLFGTTAFYYCCYCWLITREELVVPRPQRPGVIRTAALSAAPAPETSSAVFKIRDAAVGELGAEAASCSVGAGGGGRGGTGSGAGTGNEGAARPGEPGTGPRPRPGAVAAMGTVGLGGPRTRTGLTSLWGPGDPFPRRHNTSCRCRHERHPQGSPSWRAARGLRSGPRCLSAHRRPATAAYPPHPPTHRRQLHDPGRSLEEGEP